MSETVQLNKRIPVKIVLALIVLTCAFSVYWMLAGEKQVDFSAEVKPILNSRCISCHGGVKAKAGFSVLFREEALANTESGKPAIIPFHPEESEMIRRLTVNDPEERMPYKHEPLTDEEINLLKRWISQGAKWGDHWAYLPVKKVMPPDVEDGWVRNNVDRFILDRLNKEKLLPSPQAEKPTLLRRVSLDLTGIFPDSAITQKFLDDKNDKAYEQLVDSLLASPRFGERWASVWLDLARYADTKGYESDGNRNIWEYRDWVIRAFNSDMPYDRFITEQMAGDLLPGAGDDQYIATAFHRNSMSNDEGGTDNEEFRTSAVMDRVNTTWEAFMGTTFSCVQCHSHPYDPFRHKEYYQFLAYFNNTRDEDVPGEHPLYKLFDDEQKKNLGELTEWVTRNSDSGHAKEIKLFLQTGQPAINSSTADSLQKAVIFNNNISLGLRNHSIARLKKVNLDNTDMLIWNYRSFYTGGKLGFHLDSPDGPTLFSMPLKKDEKYKKLITLYEKQSGVHDIYIRFDATDSKLKPEAFTIAFEMFSFTRSLPGKGQPGYQRIEKIFNDLLQADAPTTPVLVENPGGMRRSTHVFERGNWRTLGDEVQASVPASLAFAMPSKAPASRVGLAQWMTSKQHPLVARTIVNRLWEQLFGQGIFETLEDMGTQGIAPTHQALLDHLSWKLMNEYNWSLKKLLKELVMSSAYRQDSKFNEGSHERDPFNKLYARGPRVRLSAEQVRDQNLQISGVLSTKMYGAGVMPWQPEGIWQSPYNGAKWKKSEGEDQYRRAVYTYWKRTSPYPSMISFDGAQRVVCNARRIRTNTPLQALVTLNDSVYLDLARHFAGRMIKEGGDKVESQVNKGYEIMLYRSIPPAKLKVFRKLYETAMKEYSADTSKSASITGKKELEGDAHLASMIVVANAMLNLDEMVMKN
ncbi:DUF1553 domain-containing protein [Flavihumibacter solisilvae]|uniref:DUF1553 domain-containing protein n=1 Tax=Flavihumibacter solisilvae TaxID=1349421 RepID=UPI00068B21E1|nr:DUF1553 domain-containing protein [Flavihumibacter solisilvae]